jgi:hypothetical protein
LKGTASPLDRISLRRSVFAISRFEQPRRQK